MENITKAQAREMRAYALETPERPICPQCGRRMAKAGFQKTGVGENRRRVQQYQCWTCGRKTTIIPAQAGEGKGKNE